jgi:hypothetical protein
MKIINNSRKRVDVKLWKKVSKHYGLDIDEVYILADKDNIAPLIKFRGLYLPMLGKEIIYLFDYCETGESLDWLFFHELRHYMVYEDDELYKTIIMMNKEYQDSLEYIFGKRQFKKYQDDMMMASPSEIDADMFATKIMGKYYGTRWHQKQRILKKEKK